MSTYQLVQLISDVIWFSAFIAIDENEGTCPTLLENVFSSLIPALNIECCGLLKDDNNVWKNGLMLGPHMEL